ncbi:unnamed protein product [Victoria cruziana]
MLDKLSVSWSIGFLKLLLEVELIEVLQVPSSMFPGLTLKLRVRALCYHHRPADYYGDKSRSTLACYYRCPEQHYVEVLGGRLWNQSDSDQKGARGGSISRAGCSINAYSVLFLDYHTLFVF